MPVYWGRCLASAGPIEEGDSLASGAGVLGAECGVGGSSGDAVLRSPQYGFVPSLLCYLEEFPVIPFLCFHAHLVSTLSLLAYPMKL